MHRAREPKTSVRTCTVGQQDIRNVNDFDHANLATALCHRHVGITRHSRLHLHWIQGHICIRKRRHGWRLLQEINKDFGSWKGRLSFLRKKRSGMKAFFFCCLKNRWIFAVRCLVTPWTSREIQIAVEWIDIRQDSFLSTPVSNRLLTCYWTKDSSWLDVVALELPPRPLVTQFYNLSLPIVHVRTYIYIYIYTSFSAISSKSITTITNNQQKFFNLNTASKQEKAAVSPKQKKNPRKATKLASTTTKYSLISCIKLPTAVWYP